MPQRRTVLESGSPAEGGMPTPDMTRPPNKPSQFGRCGSIRSLQFIAKSIQRLTPRDRGNNNGKKEGNNKGACQLGA